ncbi:hypothetical protein [Microbacterium sp. NPDC091662]|uniref:hypothetical protein n=1 Tax=Microbacterium sp. NPDC091662 TaxID=3364211 RepID=UPI003827C32A
MPIRAHPVTTLAEDPAQTLVYPCGPGSAGRGPHPYRQTGVGEAHVTGVQDQMVADWGCGDLDRRASVVLQQGLQRVVQAHREREEQLPITFVEPQPANLRAIAGTSGNGVGSGRRPCR